MNRHFSKSLFCLPEWFSRNEFVLLSERMILLNLSDFRITDLNAELVDEVEEGGGVILSM